MNRFLSRLGKERLYWDGGTGSVLQEKGLQGGELPERWNLTHPEEITDLAVSYFSAGSDIVNSNTFGANRLHYPDEGELERIITAGVELAREGRKKACRDEDGYIALDIGPTGRLLRPMGDLDFEEAVSIFAQVVRIGTRAGADLILIETMSDTLETKAAVLAAKEHSHLPVCVTNVFDKNGKLLTGGTVESVVAMLEGLRVDALGLNCSLGPEQMLPIARALVQAASIPVICNPNAGLPRTEEGKTVYDLTRQQFADGMAEIAKCGVHVLGGCCGTTPGYISEMIRRTRELPFTEPVPKRRTLVSSFSTTVEIGRRPVIIGERINPTGKKKFQQALRERNLDYLLQQGFEQEEAGAQILDVNVGLPGIDEAAMMEEAVTALQGVLTLPLQIDTSDPEALERGLRRYNGKPMINSVNGKKESLESVLPLAAKYGGVVVALPLDEEGIPETASGRLDIARRILEAAESFGIPKQDVIIDGLVMTVSADAGSALTTLETLRRVRQELGCYTILGVSNVSFGLPQREIISSTFFTMAMQTGLSCAIINPNSQAMMAAWRSYCALTNQDEQCCDYLAAYSDKAGYGYGLYLKETRPKGVSGPLAGSAPSPSKETGNDGELFRAVRRGLNDKAVCAARESLQKGEDPLSLVDRELVPALNEVGRGFEQGTLFLPQLLMSAEAARAAFDVIREALQGNGRESRGRIILATVKGDIHDIGKNIVRVLLENYGYEVIDLGKDVAARTIVDRAKAEQIRLVGLSALMTTTVVSMEETIRLLREEAPDVKVVVGGAVMTQQYADSIGADHYAKEAMDTVRYADMIFGE